MWPGADPAVLAVPRAAGAASAVAPCRRSDSATRACARVATTATEPSPRPELAHGRGLVPGGDLPPGPVPTQPFGHEEVEAEAERAAGEQRCSRSTAHGFGNAAPPAVHDRHQGQEHHVDEDVVLAGRGGRGVGGTGGRRSPASLPSPPDRVAARDGRAPATELDVEDVAEHPAGEASPTHGARSPSSSETAGPSAGPLAGPAGWRATTQAMTSERRGRACGDDPDHAGSLAATRPRSGQVEWFRLRRPRLATVARA